MNCFFILPEVGESKKTASELFWEPDAFAGPCRAAEALSKYTFFICLNLSYIGASLAQAPAQQLG